MAMADAMAGGFQFLAGLGLWVGSFVAIVICATRWGRWWQVPVWSAAVVVAFALAAVIVRLVSTGEVPAIDGARLAVSYLATLVWGYVFVGLVYLKRRFSPLT